MLLTHALALSANQFLRKKKSLKVCALQNWTHEIDFSRDEDNLYQATGDAGMLGWIGLENQKV